MFILLDESLASLDLWEFSSCLALDHNSLQSGKNIIWMWNGSKVILKKFKITIFKSIFHFPDWNFLLFITPTNLIYFYILQLLINNVPL